MNDQADDEERATGHDDATLCQGSKMVVDGLATAGNVAGHRADRCDQREGRAEV